MQINSLLKTLPAHFYGSNIYDEKEINAAVKVIYNQSPFRFYGKSCTLETEKFEKEAAKYYQVKYSYTSNSGTGALMLALHALDIGPGDEVIIPAFFWIAVSNAILHRGAIPVFCEIDKTLNINPKKIMEKISNKTKCVIAVHMFGGQTDIIEIGDICKKNKLKLIEDISQCNGSTINGKKLGSFGDIGIASFQLNKMITCGEGGLLITNNENYYYKAVARSDMGYIRESGISSTKKVNKYVTVGESRRFNEISAAIMRIQLKKLPNMLASLLKTKNEIKKRINALYEFQFRSYLDFEGDPGSTLTLMFNSKEEATYFCIEEEKILGDKKLFKRLIDTGQHIYYNCSNLIEKIEVLPGGFPWNLKQNNGNHNYKMGTCPESESILERSVGMSISPNTTSLQRNAIVELIEYIFSKMKK